ncbi:MAG: CinA family protein [Opitutaceae bacterium]|jgi:nicotinamide-nucleotide amidase|nr:CinA family protein [Opitutaceae bacterium]
MSELKDLMQRAPRLRIAVAESITCGHLQARIGGVSGASRFFLGGITAYSLEQKIRHLGVRRDIAEPVNCVSEEVARAMARGACGLFGCGLALATTGYAEPCAARGVPQPFAWWALAHRAGGGGGFVFSSARVDCPGMGRAAVQRRVAAAAFDALLAHLRQADRAQNQGTGRE